MCILQVCGVLDEPTQRKVWKILAEHSHLEVCVYTYMYVYSCIRMYNTIVCYCQTFTFCERLPC